MEREMSDAPSLRAPIKRRCKPDRSDWRFGVMNHVGDIWSSETFANHQEAQAYINAAKRQNPSWDLSRHRVAPVKVTVSLSSRKDGSSPHQTGD